LPTNGVFISLHRRFEYDRANIAVSEQFGVPMSTAAGWRLLPIPKVVPNPQSSVSSAELNAFAQNVGRLVTADRFSEEGRDRVLSAFRLYRTGADTASFENKLVNWWTGLEFLAKGMGGTGSIGGAVEDTVTPILMGVSVINHLPRIARCSSISRLNSSTLRAGNRWS
jgi:hypothetical protein